MEPWSHNKTKAQQQPKHKALGAGVGAGQLTHAEIFASSERSPEGRYAEYTGLTLRAKEVLGSDLEATRWLSFPSPDFQGRTPLQAFIEEGAGPILDVLGKIEHGVFF